MATRTVTVATPDGPMEVYEATPDGTATRAVVVVQEAFGVNRHIQSVARRLADSLQPSVGRKAQEQIIPQARVGQKCLEAGYFHWRRIALFTAVTSLFPGFRHRRTSRADRRWHRRVWPPV